MKLKAFQAVYPNFDLVASTDSFFGSVKYEYPKYKDSGFFNKTPSEAIYIYEIKTKQRRYRGILSCVDIEDYKAGKIKKHENTLASKEQQQVQLMIARNAMVKPILLTYPSVKAIDKFIDDNIKSQKIFYKTVFEEEKQTHKFWQISDGQKIEQLKKLFTDKVLFSYIADGHHRCSTTNLLHERMTKKGDPRDFGSLFCAFFPAHELEIHDYNRVIQSMNEISPTMFMAKLSKLFDIEPLEKPIKPRVKNEIIMFFMKECYALKWKLSVLEEYKDETVLLDANLLDQKVLNEILGIKDVKTDTRIKYVEGPKGIDQVRLRTAKSEDRVGFCLYPVRLEDLMKIADSGMVMPPKSTWFEPRMRNGLMVQEF